MKKLLLVAVSVGVFLVIIISAAILLLTPKVQTQEGAVSLSRPFSSGQTSFDNFSAANNDNQPRVAVASPEIRIEEVEVIEEKPAAVPGDKNDGDRIVIRVPQPSAVAIPETSAEKPKSQAKPAASATATAANTPKPAAPATTSAKTTTAAKPAVSKTAAVAKKSDYWVQIGAYTSIVRAEDVKEALSSRGITSIIENRQIDGRTMYRVRLGPYTSEKEANYWLSLVKSIEGFSESQVRQTVSMR